MSGTKETKLVILGNLKGGAGKSTITNFLAAYIYQYTDLSVLVVDGDNVQQTIVEWRNADELNWDAEASGKQWDEADMYDLVPVNSADFVKNYRTHIIGEYDIVLFDVPGSFEQPGIEKSYYFADMILVPMNTTDAVIKSTQKYLRYLRENTVPERDSLNMKSKVYYFLNMCDPNEVRAKQMLKDKPLIEGFPMMSSFIGNAAVSFGRDVSTIHFDGMDKMFKKYLKPFCEEILENLKK